MAATTASGSNGLDPLVPASVGACKPPRDDNPRVSRRPNYSDHADPEAPPLPRAKQIVAVFLGGLGVALVFGWVPLTPTSAGVAAVLTALGLLL